MHARFLPVFATLIAVLIVAPGLAAGQAAGEAPEGGPSPRTPWGDPDLQGTWSYASLTPLQRPADLAGRQYYTPEEAEERNFAVTQDRVPEPGQVGAYNALWFDRGTVSPDLRTALIVDPPDGRLPLRADTRERTAAEAAYRREHPADSWLDRSNWDRCITYHGVPPVSTGYNNTYHIVQAPGYVAIRVENIHDVRIIPIDGRPRLDDRIRQWNGDSRGRWEGDTLVVETANFSEQSQHRFPTSSQTVAVERFRRAADDRIDYEFTINDPTVYTQPWTVVRPLPRLDGYVIYEYACHEGNYAMTNILSGERAEERERAAAESGDGR